MGPIARLMMDTILALHRQRDPRVLVELLLDSLVPSLGPAIAGCYLIDPMRGGLRMAALAGRPDAMARDAVWLRQRLPATVAMNETPRVLAVPAASGQSMQVYDGLPDVFHELLPAETAAAVARRVTVVASAVAPVSTARGTVGFVVLLLPEPWPEDVAGYAAVHTATALAHVATVALPPGSPDLDAETGLYTRAFMERATNREINRDDRYRQVMSIVVLEPSPDRMPIARLQALAALIATGTRWPDTAARLDGGRLVVLLPETVSSGAAGFLRRLRREAGPEAIGLRGACATFPQDGRTWADLIRVASDRIDAPDALPEPAQPLRPGRRDTLRA